ncbi:hypothetical protein [Microbispora amethystogenes]|nr:hypothetical protein [Microbispora amethystogenes]
MRSLFSQSWMHEYVHAEGGLALIRRMLERPKGPLGSFGMGMSSVSMLVYHLHVIERYIPIPEIESCDSCRRGGSLENALVVYEKRMSAHGGTQPACVVTRKDLPRQRKQILFLDKKAADYRLPIEKLPELPRSGEHACEVLWPYFLEIRPSDAQEAMLRFLRSIIRMLHRIIRVLLAYLRRVIEALTFRLMVIAARLRYGHRHDADDDLCSPLLRHYLKSARGVSVL